MPLTKRATKGSALNIAEFDGNLDHFTDALALKANLNDARFTDARTPTAHTHAISGVTGLQAGLDAKAATVHTHTASQITDFGAAVDAHLDDEEVTLDAGTAADWLSPASNAFSFLTPAEWRSMLAEADISAVSGTLTFDPLAGTIPGSPSPVVKPALALAATIASNVAIAFNRTNMIPGLPYTLDLTGSGGTWTLTFSGLTSADSAAGMGGSSFTIASGKRREATIRKRRNGSLSIVVAPAEDTIVLPVASVGGAQAQNALSTGVHADSVNGDWAMFMASSHADDATPAATGLSGYVTGHSTTPIYSRVAGGRTITGAGDTQAFTRAVGTFLRIRAETFRNVTTGIIGTPNAQAGTATSITIPSLTVNDPGSGIYVGVMIKGSNDATTALSFTLGGGLVGATTLHTTVNSQPLTTIHLFLPNVSSFAGGTISWTGSLGFASYACVLR